MKHKTTCVLYNRGALSPIALLSPPQIFNFKPQNDIKSMYVYKSHILLSQTFHLGFGITIVQWPS